MNSQPNERIEMTEQQKKAQRARNIAIAIALAAFAALMYYVTVAKLGANLFNRPL